MRARGFRVNMKFRRLRNEGIRTAAPPQKRGLV